MTSRLTRIRTTLGSLSGIARGTALVGSGTLVGQGVLIASAPVLARIYDPAAFGVLATYAAAIALLVAVASLRYDFAIPISGNESTATNLLGLSVLLALITCAVVLLVVVLLGDDVARLLGVEAVAPLLWLLPIGLLVATFNQSLNSFAVYVRGFGGIARMRTVQGFGIAGTQIGIGLLRAGAFGLVAGDIAGRGLGTVELYRSLRSSISSRRLSRRRMRASARRFWGFARVMTVASLLSALALQVPFLLIPWLFDIDATGQYFMAYRMLVLPVSLVSAAVSQVFFGEAARGTADAAELNQLARRSAITLFVFSIPTYGVVFMAAPELFAIVLGAEWEQAGTFARVMAPWLALASVSSPLSSLLLIGRRERESLAFTAADVLLKSLALIAGAALGSLLLGILFMVLSMVPMNIAAIWRILRVAHVRLRELGRPVLRTVLLSTPSLVVLGLVMVFLPDDSSGLIVIAACAVAWLIAFGLAMAASRETHALLRSADG